MKPEKVTNALVERIEGKFAVVSVCIGKKPYSYPYSNLPVDDKKYVILLRKVLPPAAKEGVTIEVRLGKDGIERASPDLERAVKQAKLMNEIMDYMGMAPA